MSQISFIIGKMRGSGFIRDTATLVMGTAIGQGVAIAATPVLSRLYAPKDFGVLAVFIAVSGIVSTLLTLRYETAIPLTKDEGQAHSLIRLCMLLTTLFGALLIVLTFILPESLWEAMGISVLGRWLPVAVLSGMGAALIGTATYWFTKSGAYKQISKLRIMQGISIALLAMAAGLMGRQNGLLVAQFLGQAVPVLFIIGVLGIGLRTRFDLPGLKAAASMHAAAPKYLLPASLLDVVTQQLPIFLIARWFSRQEVGEFSMAWRVLMLPMVLIGGAVGQVFYQRFSQAWPDREMAKQILFNTWKTLFLIGAIPAVVLMLFGEQLFSWVFGKDWAASGVMASILAPMLLAMFISSPTSTCFLVLGIQMWSLMFGLAILVYRPAVFYIGLQFGSLYIALAGLVLLELVQIGFYNLVILKKIRPPAKVAADEDAC